MPTSGMKPPKAPYKRLPIKGQKNITELTAIARIKEGDYPQERLKLEIAAELKRKKKWLSLSYVGGKNGKTTWMQHLETQGKNPRMSWLEHLKAVLDWAHVDRQDEIKKMKTIHYARWVILEPEHLPGLDAPHVLFTSNFDGVLDEYLEDFAAVDEVPLNLIFGHCVDWPGARPAEVFIQYVEEHRHSASIFYANYPEARVEEVNRALDWKRKTERFIQKELPALENKVGSDWETEARTLIRNYLNALAERTL